MYHKKNNHLKALDELSKPYLYIDVENSQINILNNSFLNFDATFDLYNSYLLGPIIYEFEGVLYIGQFNINIRIVNNMFLNSKALVR